MKKQGIFLAFEGIDGAGKTKQMAMVESWCQERGYEVIITREPGGTALGVKIRQMLLDPENKAMNSLTELLLYAADRAQHVKEVIEPALNQGKIVLSDRYTLSTLAYQGYGRNLNLEIIEQLNKLATDNLKPHLTLVLDIDPQRAKSRISENREEKPDRLEQENNLFFQRTRQGYLDAAAKDNAVAIINGDDEPQAVFSNIEKKLELLLCTPN